MAVVGGARCGRETRAVAVMAAPAQRLFCGAASLLLRAQDCDDRRTDIRVTVELQSVASPVLKKDLTVRLTDDADPFFLYTLHLGDEDFQSLKSQQGLLVDFTAFPQKFIDLLQLCIQEQDKDVPRFLLQLQCPGPVERIGAACLSVVETNPFKHLTHLSLRLLSASDNDLKKYLASCLRNLKDENAALETRLQKTEEDLTKRLTYAQQTLAERSRELERVRADHSSQVSELSTQHSRELAAQRDRFQQIEEESRRRSEEERRELEAEQRRLRSQLQQRVAQAEGSARDSAERHRAADTALRDARARISALEEEGARVQQEAAALRRESVTRESERRDTDAELTGLRSRTVSLEQEARDKEQLVQRTGQALDATRQQQKKLEESLDEKQTQVGKLETTIKSLSEELLKANDIIKRLQAELKAQTGKVRLKNAVTTQQEKLLAERDASLQRERQETAELRAALDNKEQQAAKLTEQLEATVEKLEESKQLLKTNENVISWLNKQLNESQGIGMGARVGAREGMRDGDAAPAYRPCHPPQPPAPSMGLGSSQTGFPVQNFTVKHRVGAQTVTTSTPLATLSAFPCRNLSDPISLDAKYLQRRDGSIPVRGVTGLAMTRPMAPKPGAPPPLSSYFPAGATTQQQQQLHLQQSAS